MKSDFWREAIVAGVLVAGLARATLADPWRQGEPGGLAAPRPMPTLPVRERLEPGTAFGSPGGLFRPGVAESTLAEVVAPRVEALDRAGGNPTIAFLASGIEGIKVRVTAKAATAAEAGALLDQEEAELRALLGPLVFGVDEATMEDAVARLLVQQGLTLGLAESLTGGLVASRLVNVAGSSEWFRGSVVAYCPEVKFGLLGVSPGPVVSEEAALQMAEGARRVLGCDVGLSVTGVAGPAELDGQPPGTVFIALALPQRPTEVLGVRLPGDRDRVRQFSAISALDLLRRRLLERAGVTQGDPAAAGRPPG